MPMQEQIGREMPREVYRTFYVCSLSQCFTTMESPDYFDGLCNYLFLWQEERMEGFSELARRTENQASGHS